MTTFLNECGAAWGTWFLSAVVQNTIFLMLVLGALYLLRRASARVLAGVATLGIVKLAIPPFVSMHWFGPAATGTLAEPVAPLLFPFAEASTTSMETVQDLTGGLGPAAVLMLAWFSIATARLGWVLLQSVQLYVELRRSIPVDADDIPPLMRNQGLDIRQSNRVAVPLTMGLFHRRIMVPTLWNRWSLEDRQAVLKHELAHIQRWDNLVQAVEILVQAVFFFHPLVHLLVGRLRIWREMACDDLSVGNDPQRRLAYSRFLVDLAQTVIEPRPLTDSASMLLPRRSELMKRVTYQVKEKIMNPVSRWRLTLVVAALLLAVVPLSLVHGDTPPPPPKKTAPVAQPVAGVAKPATVAPVAVPAEKMVGPGDPAAPADPPPPPPAVRIDLDDNGLKVNGEVTAVKDFEDTVKKAVVEKGGHVVIAINSDGAVTMAKVHRMQDHLKDLGLRKVLYTGELGEAVPMVLPPREAKKKLAQLSDDQVLRVKVDAAGVITLEGKKVAGGDLSDIVAKYQSREPHLVVVLHTERDTRYGAFLQTLQGLKKGGAKKIAIQDPDS